MSETVRTRFAPSPTGLLHLGNARTALFAWLLARHAGARGAFVLRIEDTDLARNQAEATARLLEDLAWLGLDWDEGPGVEGPHAPYLQSARAAQHAAALARLEAAGLVYPCFCSDEDLERSRAVQRAGGRPPRYAGTCRDLDAAAIAERQAAGRVASLRFRVPRRRTLRFDDLVHGPQQQATAELGDFVVRRRDGSATFLFANAVDDAAMGITHVLRGEDHLANTPRQLLILEALGLDAPRYGHVPLVHGMDGGPLSKRDGAVSLADLRERGCLPVAVMNHLARLGHSGYPDGCLDRAALAAGFDAAHLGRAPARFDLIQLAHFQRLAVQTLDSEAFLAWADGGAPVAALVPAALRAEFVALVQGNVGQPEEAAFWARNLFSAESAWSAEAQALVAGAPRRVFEAALAEAAAPELSTVTAAVSAVTGLKGAAIFRPLRAALTGDLSGPELAAWWRLMPPDHRRARLRQASELAERDA